MYSHNMKMYSETPDKYTTDSNTEVHNFSCTYSWPGHYNSKGTNSFISLIGSSLKCINHNLMRNILRVASCFLVLQPKCYHQLNWSCTHMSFSLEKPLCSICTFCFGYNFCRYQNTALSHI